MVAVWRSALLSREGERELDLWVFFLERETAKQTEEEEEERRDDAGLM